MKKTRIRGARPADDLDRSIARRAAASPAYPRLVKAALDRRGLMRALAAERERQRIPQQAVAKTMGTSQPAVARIENGEVDLRVSTIERYAAAVGQRVRFQLSPARPARAAGTS